ncbi:MAG: divergent polysaccharide deacetylase family protein [Desulfovibrionaceae bacterium]|nr:divergent polysaccharide deacetylase family protein [Desulfovibrionaceae bacterium]
MAEIKKNSQARRVKGADEVRKNKALKSASQTSGRTRQAKETAAVSSKRATGISKAAKPAPNIRKRPKRKKGKTNTPLILALITVLLLGAGAVFWLFNGNPDVAPDGLTDSSLMAQGGENAAKESRTPSSRESQDNSPDQSHKIPPQEQKIAQPKEKGNQPRTGTQTGLPSPKPVVSADIETTPTTDLSDSGEREFETTLGSEMEKSTKIIDEYLLGMLNSQGCSGKNIKIMEVERRIRPGDSYHFQKLLVELPENSAYYANPEWVGRDITRALDEMEMGAELSSPADNHYILSVNGLVTHEIYLSFSAPRQATAEDDETSEEERAGTVPLASPDANIRQPEAQDAVLAIVIDDVGESLAAARTLAALDYPVTFAIWPRAANARKCAEIAHGRGLEILIHQPMEPMEYPKVKPGPGAVYTSMERSEIIAQVRDNIPLVPYAAGLNNHMGSKLTRNRQGVEAVLAALHGRNLFVLDSLTHGGSIFYETARSRGFPCQRRDIFLDVNPEKNAVLHQLHKSERLALTQGYAIAIGHPLPGTLAALKEWEKSRNKKIRIVRVQDLLQFNR